MFFNSPEKKELQYESLEETAVDTGERSSFLSNSRPTKADRGTAFQNVLLWKIVTGILTLFSALLLFLLAFTNQTSLLDHCLNGHSTDFSQ
jgi:hypothetical protein